MTISIRFVDGQWLWEIYSPMEGKYAQGTSPTWKGMMAYLEISAAELEKRNESKPSK